MKKNSEILLSKTVQIYWKFFKLMGSRTKNRKIPLSDTFQVYWKYWKFIQVFRAKTNRTFVSSVFFFLYFRSLVKNSIRTDNTNILQYFFHKLKKCYIKMLIYRDWFCLILMLMYTKNQWLILAPIVSHGHSERFAIRKQEMACFFHGKT